ncbi:hypothetical protein [Aquipseudomonas campi]
MNILVHSITTAQGTLWKVQLDQHGVTFRSEAEARAFVTTLEDRLRAPHPLPEQRRAG